MLWLMAGGGGGGVWFIHLTFNYFGWGRRSNFLKYHTSPTSFSTSYGRCSQAWSFACLFSDCLQIGLWPTQPSRVTSLWPCLWLCQGTLSWGFSFSWLVYLWLWDILKFLIFSRRQMLRYQGSRPGLENQTMGTSQLPWSPWESC